MLRCIGRKWPMDQLANDHLSQGLNGRVGQLRPVTSPGLKLPTQSQMADGYLKVSDLKVCVQNAKLFFTWTLEHFQTLELWKISKLQKKISKDCFWQKCFS